MGRTVGAGAARAAVVSSGSKFKFISGSGSLCLDFLSVSYQDYRGHSEMYMCCASCMQGTGQTCKRCLSRPQNGRHYYSDCFRVSTSQGLLKHRLHAGIRRHHCPTCQSEGPAHLAHVVPGDAAVGAQVRPGEPRQVQLHLGHLVRHPDLHLHPAAWHRSPLSRLPLSRYNHLMIWSHGCCMSRSSPRGERPPFYISR